MYADDTDNTSGRYCETSRNYGFSARRPSDTGRRRRGDAGGRQQRNAQLHSAGQRTEA